MSDDLRYRTVVIDRRSESYVGYGGQKRWMYFESRVVECRIQSGEVFRHSHPIEEFSYESKKIDSLVSKMIGEKVHERTGLMMDSNPHWDQSSDDLWVQSHHSGRFGAGRYSYRATASSQELLVEWKNNLLRNYHPMGYGTSVDDPTQLESGLWEARATRAGSCD